MCCVQAGNQYGLPKCLRSVCGEVPKIHFKQLPGTQKINTRYVAATVSSLPHGRHHESIRALFPAWPPCEPSPQPDWKSQESSATKLVNCPSPECPNLWSNLHQNFVKYSQLGREEMGLYYKNLKRWRVVSTIIRILQGGSQPTPWTPRPSSLSSSPPTSSTHKGCF